MYDFSISVLKERLEALKKQQLSVAEDCRDGVIDAEESLINTFSLQSQIFDLEDSLSLLEEVRKDISETVE